MPFCFIFGKCKISLIFANLPNIFIFVKIFAKITRTFLFRENNSIFCNNSKSFHNCRAFPPALYIFSRKLSGNTYLSANFRGNAKTKMFISNPSWAWASQQPKNYSYVNTTVRSIVNNLTYSFKSLTTLSVVRAHSFEECEKSGLLKVTALTWASNSIQYSQS
jgi:hypothetical protein